MNDLRLALVFAAGLLICQPGYAQPASLPMDTPVRIAGVETVCTGVSLDARENPLWNSYALKVEIAGGGGRYLGGERITLRRNEAELVSVICDGPWILFQLPPGRYTVEGELAGQTISFTAFISAGNQGRIILRFPDTDSAAPPYAMNYSDEAAQALGVHKGHVDVFNVTRAPDNGLAPNFRGGLDKKGAAIQLQWPTN